jgi:hypothetical protein
MKKILIHACYIYIQCLYTKTYTGFNLWENLSKPVTKKKELLLLRKHTNKLCLCYNL